MIVKYQPVEAVRRIYKSILVQVMACGCSVPSYLLNQCLFSAYWTTTTNFGEIWINIQIISFNELIWIYRGQNSGHLVSGFIFHQRSNIWKFFTHQSWKLIWYWFKLISRNSTTHNVGYFKSKNIFNNCSFPNVYNAIGIAQFQITRIHFYLILAITVCNYPSMP